jgi:hypothetical protein
MYGKGWDKSLPYTEFSNKEMAPFEALYGRQCRTSLF